MAKFMKGLMLAALIMLFAASLLPSTQASARQINYDLKAPRAVGAGGVQPSAVFDFSVEVDPSAVSLKPGDSALCGIIVGLITGPAQEVSLMYTIPPVTGVSASISTVKGTPPFNLMLKISTTTQTPPGTYTINVVGVSGSLQRTASVTLTVTAAGGFDFSVEVDPSAVSLKPGESASCTIDVGLVRGTAQEVSLDFEHPDFGATILLTIHGSMGTPPFTGTLEIVTTAEAPPGTYTINIIGISGTLQRITTVTLTVAAAVGFDFSIKVSPSMVTMAPGEPASPTVTVGLVGGLAQEVSLIYTIPPLAGPDPRISASISPTKGTPPFTSTLRISTTPQTPPGTYTINIVGISGTLQRTATFTLAIVVPGGFDFSVTASPDSVSLGPGESASSTLSTKLVTGPAQEVSFMYTIPQVVGVGATISPARGTPPFTSTVRISTTAQTPPGQYAINIAAVASGVEKRISITLIVLAGGQPPPSGFDFSITVTPESQSLTPEGSVVYDVYVDLTAGTSETVSLTLSGLPEDATYAFDPPTGLPYFPSKLTVYFPQYTAAGAPMPAGTCTLTVTAEGAGLVRTGTATLVVKTAAITTSQQVQATTQAPPTSVATTQVAAQTTGAKGSLGEALGGRSVFLLLLIVVIVAGAAYYVSRRRKAKPP